MDVAVVCAFIVPLPVVILGLRQRYAVNEQPHAAHPALPGAGPRLFPVRPRSADLERVGAAQDLERLNQPPDLTAPVIARRHLSRA